VYAVDPETREALRRLIATRAVVQGR